MISSPTNIIRILLVDDHAVVRSGLCAFLSVYDDFELVGEASNGLEAIEACEKIKPDVVLIDLVMPEMDGASATRIIRARFPEIQVVALTSYREDALVQNALQAGAIAYLMKNTTAEDLARAIRSAHAGRPTLAPEAAEALIQAARNPEPRIGSDLTEREHEVLEWMVQGLTNPEIAAKLVVSRSTIKFHVSSILEKLSAASRTEAVAIALREQLIHN